MPLLVIVPIEFKTESGHTAVITGIDTGRSRPLFGYVHYPNGEQTNEHWSIEGQGTYPHLNFTSEAMNSWDFETLIETAFHLVPARVFEQAGVSRPW